MKLLEVRQVGPDLHISVDGAAAVIMQNRELDDLFVDNPLTMLLTVVAIESAP